MWVHREVSLNRCVLSRPLIWSKVQKCQLVIRDCFRPTTNPLQSALIQIQALNLILGFGATLKCLMFLYQTIACQLFEAVLVHGGCHSCWSSLQFSRPSP
jgi:hypothetical protein